MSKHNILVKESQTVPIEELSPNPINTRQHSENSINILKLSLEKYGQRKPIIVQKQGMVVRAGNGLFLAAQQLGWKKISALVVDESNIDAVGYEIMDNRSAELSEWEDEILAQQLDALTGDGFDLALTGFTPEDYEALQHELDVDDDDLARPTFGDDADDNADGMQKPKNEAYFYIEYYEHKEIYVRLKELLGEHMVTEHEIDPEHFEKIITKACKKEQKKNK
jgi:hypothetical protein